MKRKFNKTFFIEEQAQNIYTPAYSENIFHESMFDIQYKGLRLIPSKSAMHEMTESALTIDDCRYILENGHDAPRKRAEGSEEKWLVKGSKTYNVVIVKSFNYFHNEEVYLITHVGKFGG